MAKKKTPVSGRDLTVTLEPISGTFNYFIAFVGDDRVIMADGSKKRSWSGKVDTSQVSIFIRVLGIGTPQFKFGIDLPGTANDQSLTLNLNGGYYESEITI